MLDYDLSIEKELNKSIKERIVQHKERFIRIFKARYLEVLPSLIKYNNAYHISVDFMKLEVGLRNGYDVVIGETANRTIQVIVYATSNQSSNNHDDLFSIEVLCMNSFYVVFTEY